MNLRRVLLVADESADWMVAGLRQLERIALSIDEFAVENNETAPVLVCLFWRPDLDQSQRWLPDNPRLTHVAFATSLDGQPYDLVLSTRLFLYRRAMAKLLEMGQLSAIAHHSWELRQRPVIDSIYRQRQNRLEIQLGNVNRLAKLITGGDLVAQPAKIPDRLVVYRYFGGLPSAKMFDFSRRISDIFDADGLESCLDRAFSIIKIQFMGRHHPILRQFVAGDDKR